MTNTSDPRLFDRLRTASLACLTCLACVLLLAAMPAEAQPTGDKADTTDKTPSTEKAAVKDSTKADTKDTAKDAAKNAKKDASEPAKEKKDTAPEPGLNDIDLLESLERIWNAKLFTAGDTDIRLNQLIIALLVLIFGILIAKRITRFVSGRLVKVSKVSEPVADTLGKILYYVAVAVVTLIAMQVAGIPTTIFTVLGGALAIGVGFGAQNLFNNLISGVIILTEKPIRRRDIVEIEGTEGIVAEIGNRRTRLRRADGIDVLVPNSKFLESNVVNWTLHDAKVRGQVDVGVAYGSPVKQVRDLLMQTADEHKEIERTPPPIVLFTEFGDNTLNFSLFFWTNIQTPLDRKRIESALRFHIDELLHEHSITIAFPQRDVHLDTLKPLEVRMIDGNNA